MGSLKNFHDRRGVKTTELKFFVKLPKGNNFEPLKFTVTELRDNCSEDLKQRHFLSVVDGLSKALDVILDDAEFEREKRAKEQDEFDKDGPDGYQFRTTSAKWEDYVQQPQKGSKIFERMQQDYRQMIMD